MEKEMQQAIGKMMALVMKLNEKPNIEVFVCYQGNTKCVCLTVLENEKMVYSRKFFTSNCLYVFEIIKDLEIKLEVAQCKSITPME
ncbi:MAG: hypothetical protein SOZ48_00895 [Eubacterium sp.]|nr:hypothetical protein [Eubacterium sp.]